MTLLVFLQEEFRADDAFLVQRISRRMKYAGERILAVHFGVSDTVGVNGLAAGVGQEWKVQGIFVHDCLQDFDARIRYCLSTFSALVTVKYEEPPCTSQDSIVGSLSLWRSSLSCCL